MNSDKPDTTDEGLWALLNQASDAIARIMDYELEQQGTSLMQAAVLAAIADIGESASVGQIKKQFTREYQTVLALLERMEKRGLVRSRENPNRKRAHLYSLTEMGRELLEKSRDTTIITKIFECISEEDKQSLVDPLLKIKGSALEEFVYQKVQNKISQFIGQE